MKTRTNFEFKLLPIAAAILLTYGNANAEVSSEVLELISPESSVTAGIGGVNNARDAKRFSQYTGFNRGGSLLLDLDYNRRDDASGFWTQFSARNLGLDTRELSFSQSKLLFFKSCYLNSVAHLAGNGIIFTPGNTFALFYP